MQYIAVFWGAYLALYLGIFVIHSSAAHCRMFRIKWFTIALHNNVQHPRLYFFCPFSLQDLFIQVDSNNFKVIRPSAEE